MFKRSDVKTKLFSLVLSATTISLPITYAHPKPENLSTIQKNKSWIKKHRGKLGLATGTLIGSIGIPAALIGSHLLSNKLADERENEAYIEELEAKFGTLSENKYTPKQRGAMWCWAACLEGLYNYYKKEKHIENNVTQEDIVKATYKKNPSPFYYFRTQSLIANSFYYPGFFKAINSLNTNLILKYALIKSDDRDVIKNSILNYYDTIDKNPFMIIIPTKNAFHFINIISIDNRDKIIIEDPEIGMSWSSSLDPFITANFFTTFSKYCSITMMTLIDKRLHNTTKTCIPDEIFYTKNNKYNLYNNKDDCMYRYNLTGIFN